MRSGSEAAKEVKSCSPATIGAASHMAGERFRVGAGFEALHIPFRGPTDALTAAMRGEVDFYFPPVAPTLPLMCAALGILLKVCRAVRHCWACRSIF